VEEEQEQEEQLQEEGVEAEGTWVKVVGLWRNAPGVEELARRAGGLRGRGGLASFV